MSPSSSRYQITKLAGGWVIEMVSNGHMMEGFFATEPEAKAVCAAYERGERRRKDPPEVWIIDGAFAIEPSVGGQMIGELAHLDLRQYTVVATYTQREFDALMEAFHDEHGHYPDT